MTNLQTPPQQSGPDFGQPYGQPQQPYYGHPHPGLPTDPAQAAAYAKAARAHAKQMRPWFKKKRFVVPLSLVALGFVSQAINGGGSTEPARSSAPAQQAAAGTTDQAAKPAAGKTDTAADKTAQKTEDKTAEQVEAPAAAGIGTAVKSGDFTVTITKVRTGVKQVGGEYLNEKADGQFVLVNLKVTNDGNEAHYLFGDDLKLKDAQGREFSVDSTASIYVSENNPLLEEINPGNTSKGTLAFDLPKGVEPTQVEIDAANLFSEPTVVSLSD